jgi:hypothetical protein
VIRGSKALDMVKAVDPSIKPADAGYEYLLARVRFIYGPEGNLYYHLYRELFKAYSPENKEYSAPTILSFQPRFINESLYPGETIEGWIPFIVAQNDSKPVMNYTVLSSWFQLF